jgi:hypothetical protein
LAERNSHNHKVHAGLLRCSVCMQKFNIQTLMKHIVQHSKKGKLPSYKHYKFQCTFKVKDNEECGLKFVSYDKLIFHECLKHTKKKIKIYCEYCG